MIFFFISTGLKHNLKDKEVQYEIARTEYEELVQELEDVKRDAKETLGESNFKFKIPPLDVVCLKKSADLVFFPTPVEPFSRAIGRVRNVNKATFWTQCTICWPICIVV